jgi:hypothetical protein
MDPRGYSSGMDDVTPEATIEYDRPTFTRGRPDAICGVCLKPFKSHPLASEPECLDDAANKPFLTRLCDGALVKLGF